MADIIRPKGPIGVTFCGVKFENPFCLSSSPVGNHFEMCSRAFDAGWGGIVYKTLNLEDKFRVIMPSPRLNAFHNRDSRFVALQNAEQISDRPIKDNLKDISELKKKYPAKVLISSIMGYAEEDWEQLARMSEEAGADMIELNFSCPQMARKDAGHRIGQDFDAIARFTAAAKRGTKLPVMAKMTPNITDMMPPALAAKEGGADAIAAINTLRSISEVDVDRIMPLPEIHGASGITGLSGTAVRPLAMRFIAELHNSKELGLPISGIGGIESWKDAVRFILLGAGTLQVTTAIMRYGYRIVEDLAEGLSDYLLDRGIGSLDEIRGAAAKKLVDPSQFTTRWQVVSSIDEEKCIGCGQCKISCFDGANQAIVFDAEKRKASVDKKRCVGCLLCKHVCPVWDCITSREVDTSSTPHAAIF